MNGVELAFVLLGAVALGAGFLVVTTSRIVHAALWLAVSLGAVAGCFLLLTAELLAWVQVLIYVGAVIVLVLFALMLTRAPIGPTPGARRGRVALAAVVAAATAGVLLVTQLAALGGEVIDLEAADVGGGRAVGSALFRAWVLPFEVLSVLLLAALVGAIVISRGRGGEDGQ
ncbi:MAG TPA: NADH-quinone oxidoreductase subunit J [Jiangellaceae bacterium]|nr:NADH-quinone oxidoreductase subunit J [Jiangellaceae bacterium]